MDRYAGLDAHARSCTLGVIGPSGKRLKSMVVETNGQALVEAVRSIPGRVHLCLECKRRSLGLSQSALPLPRQSRGTYSPRLLDTPRRGPRLAPSFATLPDRRPRFGAGGGGEWTPDPPALGLGAQKFPSRR